MPEVDLLTYLMSLEEDLLSGSTRRKPHLVESLLADDFREFGSSSTLYNKAEVLSLLANETPTPIIAENFNLAFSSADAALLTYTSIKQLENGGSQAALRSSLWVRRAGEWKLLFHQGTKIL